MKVKTATVSGFVILNVAGLIVTMVVIDGYAVVALVINILRLHGREILGAVGFTAWSFFLVGVTVFIKNRVWMASIAGHLDEISQAEIAKRDERIRELDEELSTEKKYSENLFVKVRALTALSEQGLQIAGNGFHREALKTQPTDDPRYPGRPGIGDLQAGLAKFKYSALEGEKQEG